ncbi:tRNA-specific adenosine deaminase [Buchnera aphidicola (Cinara pseudotaxifoliae)]|uniref:tRNA-specific adenosine deaminase n=1 Tax=Buchnera aphidicola (Cinara pseudotaxifoliae) TaxID=655384 RepID=A0A451DGU8_9GAMM|nr:tRNA adenosine(34) deaminase TadA [Buchnera aphidicola]VFP85846.1 tRNA-specific adenosine deaminase [Buchnera aphidicola (Cinara pseudotaxifoliae)]
MSIVNIDNYWMKQALKQAYCAKNKGEIPIGSVLVKDNDLVSSSQNSCISLFDVSAHAEILAIQRGSSILKNYRLYNTSLYVTHEPCLMCSSAIISARIRKVVYGSYSFKKYKFSFLMNLLYIHNVKHHIKDIKSGILLNECSNLLKDFFKNKR